MLEALALTGLWAAFFLLSRAVGPSDRGAGLVFARWIYGVSAMGVATVCSLAVACAVDARIDGVGVDLRMAFGEVRRHLPTLLCWWLISMGAVIALGLAATAVTRPLPAILVIACVWGVGSLFVVPAIALQSGGPLRSLAEAFRFLRIRWARALAGLFVIGFLSGLAFIACTFLFRAAAGGHFRTLHEPLWRFGIPLLIFYLVYALMAATRGAFAMILARDALGDLPGEPPPAIPRRRTKTIRRVVFGALAVMVGLFILATIVDLRSNPQPPTPQTQVPASTPPSHVATYSASSFATPIRNPMAKQLRPGAPVVLSGKTIGRVTMIHTEHPPVIEVFYEVDPTRESTVIHSRMRVAKRDGRAYLVVAPN